MKVRFLLAALAVVLASCKHPLRIVGQGDIFELNEGVRGCTLEEFQAQATRCTENDVVGDYNVIYDARPRPGWRFVSWNGACGDVPPGQCALNLPASFPAFWDETFPGIPTPPLVATFGLAGAVAQDQTYFAAVFGADDFDPFSALLRADLFVDGSYSYEAVLESSTFIESFGSGMYEREDDGLLSVAGEDTDFSAGGVATLEFDLVALVDLDGSDNEVSVAYLTPTRTSASNAILSGEYFCGFLDTDPASSFTQATLNGDGTGTFDVLESTSGLTGGGPLTYAVTSEGSVILNIAGFRLVGGIADDGNVITLTRTEAIGQGSGMCIKASTDQSIATMVGEYYGASASSSTASTSILELEVFAEGSAAFSVLVDSFGGGPTPLDETPFAVVENGRISSGFEQGMVSSDGRIAFLLVSRPDSQPEFTVYIRKSD
ncbi:MAG: hypothetical protein QNI86_11370 [Halieaceae bacterium]|nr:hypothetical protein [Halieaceae bacterium]